MASCILLSDQTVTPLHLFLQVSTGDHISWIQCRLGEFGEDGMIRTPYRSATSVTKRLFALEGRADLIDWAYKVTFASASLTRKADPDAVACTG
jgi:hypothetical protein